MYGQLINLLDRSKIMRFSREDDGERYVKYFDAWQHLVVMLYAVIRRFDSLREIVDSMFPEARKLAHLGIDMMPRRSTLSDANSRRSEKVFESVYRDLYATYKDELSSDSRRRQVPKWLNRLRIIDSTTITLFSNLIFKGVGRHPKNGRKKGGIKVHANIHANEAVPSDIRFTSAATNDSFMLRPSNYSAGDILALDRAYINYAKFEELTSNGVVYVTKMKKALVYQIEKDTMYVDGNGQMVLREQCVVFTKHVSGGEDIRHHARIITYVDMKKHKPRPVSLLTNDMKMDAEEIIEIYRKRWHIELLFKQLKQNFPLRYFYGESANAIKIQIWVTLIANLLLWSSRSASSVPGASPAWRPWCASCSCTTSTATLSSRNPKKTGRKYCRTPNHHRASRHFSTEGAYFFKKTSATPGYRHCGRVIYAISTFSGQQ